jgi:diacylglycerol kinase (ATP)
MTETARTWLIVVNPLAGLRKSEKTLSKIHRVLVENAEEIIVISENRKDLAEAKVEAILKEYGSEKQGIAGIIGIGGDGLIHMLANLIWPDFSHLPILVIPKGSGNDFARSLGFGHLSIDEIIRISLTCNPEYIDVIEVNQKIVLNIFSSGFDAEVNDRADRLTHLFHWLKYPIALLLQLRKLRLIRYRLQSENGVDHFSSHLTTIANGKFYGGGVKISPNSILDDGQLEMITISSMSRIRLLLLFPLTYFGKHLNSPSFHLSKVESGELSIEGESSLSLSGYGDGELVGFSPFSFKVRKNALKVWKA